MRADPRQAGDAAAVAAPLRTRSVLLSVGALAGVALVLGACGGISAGALAHKSPRQILTLTDSAAQASGGVHYELEATQGSARQTITGDAGSAEGDQQRVTGAQDVLVELVNGTAYLKANAAGLEASFALSAAHAATYAGKWISLVPSDAPFAPISESVTLAAVVGEIIPTGSLTELSPSMLGGRHVLGVRGGLPGQVQNGVSGSAVLYVDTAHPNLPVGFTGTASNGKQHITEDGLFNQWGEHVTLTAPAGAVPYSSIPHP